MPIDHGHLLTAEDFISEWYSPAEQPAARRAFEQAGLLAKKRRRRPKQGLPARVRDVKFIPEVAHGS